MAKPMRPEPKYFLKHTEGKNLVSDYLQRYFEGGAAPILGEKSTTYLERPDAGRRIKQYFPSAKILIMLRDPVKRAISNYYFSVENNLETRDIEDVFLGNLQAPQHKSHTSSDPFNYVERGIYWNHISPYYEIFPPENIKILVNEQLTSNRDSLTDVYSFLGASRSFSPFGFENIVNKSAISKRVPDTVTDFLREFYRGKNEPLEKKIDITSWHGDD